jgi:hypothetical protein
VLAQLHDIGTMAPVNSNKSDLATAAHTSPLQAHVVFQRYNMAIPPKILRDDVERAIRILDQHDPSTATAGTNDLEAIDYNNQRYTVKDDLRPMAEAAGIVNLHQKGTGKAYVAKMLAAWDSQNAPRIAALVLRSGTEPARPVIPKRVVPNQDRTGVQPAESKKRKHPPTGVSVAKKRRTDTNGSPEDDDVEMEGQEEPTDGSHLPQATTEAARLSASGDDCQEGDKPSEAETEEVQVPCPKRHSTKKRVTGSEKATEDVEEGDTAKTAEQLAEENRRLKDKELEQKLHDARRLGGYSDPILAERFRVVYKTVRVPMGGGVQEEVEALPVNQLGMWEYAERLEDEARKEGRESEVWMGGGASPPRSLWAEYEDDTINDS